MNKTKTKYRNYDGWTELRKRLEREIELNESFVPDEDPVFTDAETTLDFLSFGLGLVLPEQFDEIYDILFRTYPIIKTKVSKAVFPSWLIVHSVDELKVLINYK
jgi:hypothetical protein